MIEVHDLSLIYTHNQVIALQNIHFSVSTGELVFLLGESGAGKTSLIKILMGTVIPTTGKVSIGEYTLTNQGMNARTLIRLRRQIGPIFQDFKLFYGRTALENVLTGIRTLGPLSKEQKHEAIQILTQVGLKKKINERVDFLSFGERQRVAVARAVARKPALILADEPTGNLDQKTAREIFSLLAELKTDNTTVLITTHAAHLIEDYGGRRLLLDQGELV